MNTKLWLAGIMTLSMTIAPGLAQAGPSSMDDNSSTTQTSYPADNSTPGAPAYTNQRSAQYPADANRDLNSIEYGQRDAFSSKVENKLDKLDEKARALPEQTQQEFSEISDKVRSDLEQIDQINVNDWRNYRQGVTQNINNLEQMIKSQAESRL